MSDALDVANMPWVVRTRATLERWWDRVDRMVLRLQGRVDTPGYDRGLPYAFSIVLGALLILIALARHHSLLLGEDTAKFAQATWQISEGLRPDTTLSGGHIVAEQGSLILYPLGLLANITPDIQMLLIVRALALAVTIIPLWRLARTHGRLGIGVSSVVVLAYSLYAAVHAMNASDFAPATLAVPALMWAVLFGFNDRDRLTFVASVFVLCCRADLGLVVLGLGILFLLERKRHLGTVIALLGLGWFLISMYALQPWLGDGGYAFLDAYAAFGDTPLRVLWGIISSPWQFLRTVGSVANFEVLVSLLAPVLFLPLTAPRYLMPAIPLYVLYMGAEVPAGPLSEAGQTVPITVFVFVALVFALQRAGRTLVKRVRVERRIVLALVLTSIIFFVRDAETSPYAQPWEWGSRDAADESRLAAIEQLPANEVPVRASGTLLPLLSERLGVFALDTTTPETLEDKVDASVMRVDWILLDPAAEPSLSGEDIFAFRSALGRRGWERIEVGEDSAIEIFRFTGIVAPGQVELLEESVEPDG
ncbi:MAG: DUF2079 domain-containing protein [Actinomycetota bacterium]